MGRIRSQRGYIVATLIVVVFSIAIAIAAQQRQPDSYTPRSDLCADEQTRNKIREILLGGLEAALQSRVQALFEVWMRDSTGQPGRAADGIEKGIDAYVHAREKIITWDMKACHS